MTRTEVAVASSWLALPAAESESPPMRATRPRVLLDTTPLRGESVLHGIGRYIYDLLVGLEETRDEWKDELTIEAIEELSLLPRSPISGDLAAVADGARSAEREADWPLVAKRWVTLGRTALEHRTDVLHVLQARGLPLLLPVRSVVTCYDLIPLRYPKQYFPSEAARAWRWAKDWHRYRLPTRVAVISARTGTDLSLLDVPEDRIDVIPTGIDLSQWSKPDQSEDLARRNSLGTFTKPYAIYVGFCDYRKNVRGMFEALALARRDEDMELVWAGDLPPPKLAAMKELARAHGVEDAVRFLGYVADADLAALYRQACALLFISRIEGFGLPVAEAMAAGCPTIVARASGCDEVCGDAGIVVDADDARAAADAMRDLVRSPELRADLAKRGRARVGQFDRREMARGYVKSYLAALPSRGH